MTGYKVVKNLKEKGWPTANKHYKEAHEKADAAEKKKYGKSYGYMKKVDSSLKRGELAGKNTKTGKIEISKKVPSKYRQEVAMHEKREYAILKQENNKRRRKK